MRENIHKNLMYINNKMYKKINIDLSDSQVDKLKHTVKNGISTTLRLDKKMINSSGQHELFLTNTQINKIANSIGAADIRLSKTQLKELIQRGDSWVVY